MGKSLNMDLETTKQLIKSDKDFIYSKRFDNSLSKLLEKYPEGVPNKVIAQVLLITEEEVEKIVEEAVLSLRKSMVVE